MGDRSTIERLRRGVFDKVVDIGYRYAVEALRPDVVARLCGGSS